MPIVTQVCESCSVVSDSLWQHGLYGPCNFPGIFPIPGIEPRSPTLQADSLPAEPQGKPKDTEVGSLSLLQQIFLTQESNWSLLHCRWILYPLSYQGSPLCHKDAYDSFVHNCQNLEAIKMPFSRWMNKLWHIQTMKYYLVLKRKEMSY